MLLFRDSGIFPISKRPLTRHPPPPLPLGPVLWCRVSIPQSGSGRLPCTSRQGECHAPFLLAGFVAVSPGICDPDTVHQCPDPALQKPHVFGHEEARGGRKRVPYPLRPEWSVLTSPSRHGGAQAWDSFAGHWLALGALGGRCCFMLFFPPSVCSKSSFALCSNDETAGEWPGGRALPSYLRRKHPSLPCPRWIKRSRHRACPSKQAG